MRVEQPKGSRGSLKWIQLAIKDQWPSLNGPIATAIGSTEPIDWRSPLESDSYAEYRDASFLERVGQERLAKELETYWPARGPQWDALGMSGANVLLVEAKAHVSEMCSPGTSAGEKSRGRIEAALNALSEKLGADSEHPSWANHFYQLANRLAYLDFLRTRGVSAWLVLVNFLGDIEMRGPSTSEAWEAAYEVAFHVMGLPKKHLLSRYILHIYPSVPTKA